MSSLWGEDFELKEVDVKKVLKKATKPKVEETKTTAQKLKSKIVSIKDKMSLIEQDVNSILGHYKEDTICIRTNEDLIAYFDKAIENGIIAVDTETNNTLNTIDCKLMGLCIYTPGLKNAYVPVNHCHYEITYEGKEEKVNLLEKVDNQVTEEQIGVQLQRLLDTNTKCIFHNAYFDIIVLKTTCGVKLQTYWDTSIGCKILNENEFASLKEQYKIHINPEQDKYNIEHLFQGLPYSIFEPDLFALYAATDSYMTYELYKYQMSEFEKPENAEILNLMYEIELPIIDVIVDMKLIGINVDLEYATKMSTEYHKKLDAINEEIMEEYNTNLKPLVDEWRLTPEANSKKRVYPAKKTKMSEADIIKKFPNVDEKGQHYKMSTKTPSEQLSEPVDMASPTQLQILLYDIMKVPVVDGSDPRGTGADILKELSERNITLCQLLMKMREVDILINNFIDKMPTFVQQKTGKLHCSFKSIGADTGRFSSEDPSTQQIPSHAKTIRLIFAPSKGYAICGADFSAQEPRSTASLAKDEKMLNAYETGKDLYATIGAACMHVPYEQCLEFNPITHELQPDGKRRRSQAKAILLGICYGMGAKSLAERMNLSEKEAEKIIEDFYAEFKGVDQLTKDSQEMLKRTGYVTDMWGRRRHLPDAQLPDFTIKPSEEYVKKFGFNPLLGTSEHTDTNMQLKIAAYQQKLSKLTWKKDIDKVINEAKRDDIRIINNRGFKNRAFRQCLNARIQGTAASMTKKAMIMINQDAELKRLGFRLLLTIHDEVLGEAPIENCEAATKRLSEVMVDAAKTKCICKFKCDGYICYDGWYEDEASGEVLNDFNKLCKTFTHEEALNKIHDKYKMFNSDSLTLVCNEEYKLGVDSLKLGPNYYKKV